VPLPNRCAPINNQAFVRPDLLIYDQYYLTSLGLSVTWDNPDIQLYLNGLAVCVPIGSTQIDPGCERTTGRSRLCHDAWTAPTTPGHYCIQVLLQPVDDSNTPNNQENTDVGTAHSPALFTFTLRNARSRPRTTNLCWTGTPLARRTPCSALIFLPISYGISGVIGYDYWRLYRRLICPPVPLTTPITVMGANLLLAF
jgi:hypothetical protein